MSRWTFLSNYSHVLICIVRDPEIRVRDIGEQVGITDRAVMRIIGELEEAGILEHEKIGRRNHYSVHLDAPLRHPLEEGASLRELLKGLVDQKILRSS